MIQSPSRLADPSRRLRSAIAGPLPAQEPAPRPKFWSRAGLRRNWPGALVLGCVLAITLVVHWRGFAGWPGDINYDEGVYMSQAYAVQFLHSVAPYTYTYDHPFMGWFQIAGYTWMTHAFQRDATSVIAGREFMLLVHMISSLFLYLLARRIGMRQLSAGAAVLLFSLSPLGLMYQRLVFLDNLAVMWAIIALWAVASPWRSWGSARFGGLAFAMAVLSKETILILVFGIVLTIWDQRDPRNFLMRVWIFGSTFVLSTFVYLVYALVKNELIPGRGHVSLLGTLEYQLVSRAGTGSLLDPTSGTYHAAIGWLHSDPYLLGVGTIAAVAALLIKRLRAVGLCLVIQVLAMCRNGYLPFAYATALFPFAALSIAGVGDRLWTAVPTRAGARLRWLRPAVTWAIRVLLVGAIALSVAGLARSWAAPLRAAMTASPNTASHQATVYIVRNLPTSSVIITQDDSWTDLTLAGRHPMSEFKVDLDPKVHAQLTQGWRSVNYLLLGPSETPAVLDSLHLPTVATALRHARVVKRFGVSSPLILYEVVVSAPPN